MLTLEEYNNINIDNNNNNKIIIIIICRLFRWYNDLIGDISVGGVYVCIRINTYH